MRRRIENVNHITLANPLSTDRFRLLAAVVVEFTWVTLPTTNKRRILNANPFLATKAQAAGSIVATWQAVAAAHLVGRRTETKAIQMATRTAANAFEAGMTIAAEIRDYTGRAGG